MGDFVGNKFNSIKTGAFLDFITAVVGLIWVVAGFVGGIKVVSHFVDISYVSALFITLILIGGYILLSGYRVVLITDVVQAVVIFGLLGLIMVALGLSVDLTEVIQTVTEPVPITLMFGIAIYGFFSIFGSADRYQLIYSAKNLHAARRGMAWGIVPFTVAFVPIVIIGLFMRLQDVSLDPDIIFLTFLNEYSAPALLPFASVMLVAGLMSTADTWIYAIASHLQNAFNKWRKQTQGQSIKLSVSSLRKMVVMVLVAMGISSFFFRELITLAILSAIISLVVSVPMLYVISNGKYTRRFVAATILGILGAIGGVAIFGSVPAVAPIPIIFSAIGLLIPISLLDKIKIRF